MKDRLGTFVTMTAIASPFASVAYTLTESQGVGYIAIALIIPLTVTLIMGLLYVIYDMVKG